MLYTRKGDSGTTTLCQPAGKRISKSSLVFEALGSIDELNAWLGLVKTKNNVSPPSKGGKGGFAKESKEHEYDDIFTVLESIQQNLFIIQAEIAGAGKTITTAKVKQLEKVISRIEEQLPPIHKFFLAGGTELSAMLDVARTLARRAERHVLAAADKDQLKISQATRSYLNRLSSILFALERLVNIKAAAPEKSPSYK